MSPSKTIPDEAATRAVVASLSPEERRVLPARLRALSRDKFTNEWNAAKAERDAALAALVYPPDHEDESLRGLYRDPSTAQQETASIKERWTQRKAELLARQPAPVEG